MTYQKIMVPIISLLAGFFLGLCFSYFNYENRKTYANEKIVSREIALLEEAKAYAPPCDEILNLDSIAVTKEGNLIMLWKKSASEDELEKFVITEEFDSAVDVIRNECRGNDESY